MKNLKIFLLTATLMGLTAVPTLSEAKGRVHVRIGPPRAARVVFVKPAKRYRHKIWVNGHYRYTRGRYVWLRGHYIRHRPHHRYIQPHWVKTRRGHYFVAGHWVPRR